MLLGTKSATLVKPDEHDELRGHQDPDPEKLMLPEWSDVKTAFDQFEAYTDTEQSEALCPCVQPSRKGPSMSKMNGMPIAKCYPVTGFNVNMTNS